MRRRKIFLYVGFIFIFIINGAGFDTAVARAENTETEGENEMTALMQKMQPGWNLGNTFDATGGEMSWGNPVTTQEMIDAIAAAGFKSFRLPVTWGARSGGAPDYIIPEAELARVREVAGWALENNMIVMLNLHHEYEWLRHMADDHDATLARFNSYWTQIASAFGGLPPEVIFESINEPRFEKDWNRDAPEYFVWLDELNKSFYNIVRQSGGINATRPLALTTITGSTAQPRMDALYQTMAELNDPRLIATVHYYGHYHFSVNIGGVTSFTDEVKEDIDSMLKRCANTFTGRGIPVVIGEFGLLAFDRNVNGVQHGEMLKYFNYLTAAAKAQGIPVMLWDNGQHFDRIALSWRDLSMLDTIMGNMNGSVSQGETDHIMLQKQSVIADVPVVINGPGRLTGVEVLFNQTSDSISGDRVLSDPDDYHYDAENKTLTFSRGFLLSLPSHPLGETTRLVCHFAEGPDWAICVIPYDLPMLEAAQAVGATLKIPARFNGDELIAMQALYIEKGYLNGNAGPETWTPFQQINRCFSAGYEDGSITLLGDFINSLRDGVLRLSFHFLSGSVVDYTLTKEGAGLTGQPVAKATPSPTAAPTATAVPTAPPTPTNKPPTPSPTTAPAHSPTPTETAEVKTENRFMQIIKNPALPIGAGILVIGAVITGFIKRGKSKR